MSKLKDFTLPLILLLEIILCLTFGAYIPEIVKSSFYSISLFLKDVLLTLLPFIIFAILAANLSNLSKGAFAFTAMAFICVILSNFTSTMVAGSLGTMILDIMTIRPASSEQALALTPLWNLPIWNTWFDTFHPSVIAEVFPISMIKSLTNDMGLFAGIICGLSLALINHDGAKSVVKSLHGYAFAFFRKLFIPVLPLFILGYILNMEHSGVLASIFENYFQVVVVIAIMAFSYIIILYGITVGFHPKTWIAHIKELIPAALTGFSTMSSASALPLVIEGVRQNTKPKGANSEALADESATGIVPISINIHLVGDCFTIPILALAILVAFGMPLPSAMDFFIFTIFFVLAKFAVAAVPGGGILVMIPILEKYLGFTPEMISLITALYILFDPIITAANIFGNGAFAGLFNRIYKSLNALFTTHENTSYSL